MEWVRGTSEIDKETREQLCPAQSAALVSLTRMSTFFEHNGAAIVAACTLVLIVCIAFFCVALRTFRRSAAALHDALREAEKRQAAIAQRSADAATRAATAAEASVTLMTDTAQRQLRAYASVQTTLMELLETPKGPLRPSHEQEHGTDSSP